MPAKVDFVFFDAGGGHRSAASALASVVESQRRPWQVRMLNLQEVLDSVDPMRRLTGLRVQDGYNLLLKKEWTIGSPQMLKGLHAGIRLHEPAQIKGLIKHWRADPPDMVVSLIPNFNRALYRAFVEVRPQAPMVTILTDIADYPPHFWIEDQDQWVICGSDQAVSQAIEIGIRPERVRKASGMILRPHFYEPIQVDRRAERQRLGLDPDRPAGLVLFGGYGAGVMLDIAERLQSAESGPQLICVCGRNRGLADRIRNLDNRHPIHVEGFTKEIPYFMSLADFFIGKPGPGSISEAIHMNLPVIVRRNARTLPQERYNADWITENKLGLVIPSFQEIGGAVRELLEPERFGEFRAAAAAIENRAVFEIPDILDEILEASD